MAKTQGWQLKKMISAAAGSLFERKHREARKNSNLLYVDAVFALLSLHVTLLRYADVLCQATLFAIDSYANVVFCLKKTIVVYVLLVVCCRASDSCWFCLMRFS